MWMQTALFLIVTVTTAACSDAPAGRTGSRGNDSTSEVTGEAGGPCYPNGTCNAGLVCMADRCETDGALRCLREQAPSHPNHPRISQPMVRIRAGVSAGLLAGRAP